MFEDSTSYLYGIMHKPRFTPPEETKLQRLSTEDTDAAINLGQSILLDIQSALDRSLLFDKARADKVLDQIQEAALARKDYDLKMDTLSKTLNNDNQ
jgi:hypothetical protein